MAMHSPRPPTAMVEVRLFGTNDANEFFASRAADDVGKTSYLRFYHQKHRMIYAEVVLAV